MPIDVAVPEKTGDLFDRFLAQFAQDGARVKTFMLDRRKGGIYAHFAWEDGRELEGIVPVSGPTEHQA